jgi:hypothetical protein
MRRNNNSGIEMGFLFRIAEVISNLMICRSKSDTALPHFLLSRWRDFAKVPCKVSTAREKPRRGEASTSGNKQGRQEQR